MLRRACKQARDRRLPGFFEVARAVPPALASTSAASSARGAFRRRVLLVRGARHPFGSFAAARWASGPRSPLSLARGGLDPRCERRLFTRAAPEGHVPLDDFCNRYDPRARPSNRSNPAHPTGGRPRAELGSQVASPGACASPRRVPGVANRGVMGQGPQMLSHRAASFEKRSLAFEALPQPDRLGHLLSLARGDVGRWCRRRPALR